MHLAVSYQESVTDTLRKQLTMQVPPKVRFHTVPVLQATCPASLPAIAALLKSETVPENLVVELRTLVNADKREDVLRLAKHASTSVREEAANTIGRLKLEGTSQLLIQLSKDKNLSVRVAAFMAMGRHPDLVFLPVFLKCLENVRRALPQERNAVVWAAGQFTPASPDEYNKVYSSLAHRIYLHCTRPTIPEESELVFDDTTVIVNGMQTLVRWAKSTQAEEILGFAKTTIGLYNVTAEEVAERNSKNPDLASDMPNDQLTRSVAIQLLQFLEDKPITQQQIEFNEPAFPISSTDQLEQN